MTLTEWKKALRTLETTKPRYIFNNGVELSKHQGYYGAEYSLYSKDGNCITVEYDLLKIKSLLVE